MMQAPIMPDPARILEMANMVQKAMEQQAEMILAPRYPSWYRETDYPKPEAGAMLQKAQQLEAEFTPLRRRMQEELRSAQMKDSGVFAEDKENPDTEPWVDTSISGEIELISYQLADAELRFSATPRRRDLRDEAANIVDFAESCIESAERIHARTGNGSLKVEKARTLLTTGRLAWHCMLNLDADEDEMPFVEHLVDPASCYPVFESHRGLRIMVRSYQTTVGEAVAEYDTSSGDMYESLIAPINRERARTQQKSKRREEESCSVIEYWDRRWRAIFIDGQLAREPMEHKYGFVPFVYKLSALGMPAFMRDPENDLLISETGETYFHNRDVSMPTKGIGLPTLMRIPTRLREAFYTRLLTAWSKSVDPPIGVYMDDVAYSQGTPSVDRSRNAINPFKMGRHELVDVPVTPDGNVMAPLLQGVADNTARLQQPPTAHGLNDHSNVSGYATQGLNEAGRIKLVPHLRTLEEFETECMEMRLRMFRDWGYLVKQGSDGEYGSLAVPHVDASPHEDQVFELTPGDLKRAGIKITASLTSMPLQMLGPVANAVGILMQLGLADEVQAHKLLNTKNPYKVMERVNINKVLNDPIVLESEAIQALMEKGEVGRAAYITARKMNMKAQEMAQGAGGAGPSSPMGDSQAAMGRPPGPGSGPQGPVGPPSSPVGTEP